MHVCHLGIMMVANGSGLKPAIFYYYILSFANAPSQKIIERTGLFTFSTSGPHISNYIYISFIWAIPSILHIVVLAIALQNVLRILRNLLIRSGVYGDPGTHARSVLCSRAYLDFKNFCSLNKISCSQPVFKERYVTLLRSISF